MTKAPRFMEIISCLLGQHDPGDERVVVETMPPARKSMFVKGDDGGFVLVRNCRLCKDEVSRRTSQFITIGDGSVLDARVD